MSVRQFVCPRPSLADSRGVIVTKELKPEDLFDLGMERALGIRIPGYLPAPLCRRVSRHLLRNPRLNGYRVEPRILRDGQTLFDAAGDAAAREEYFGSASSDTRALRELFVPYLSPIDRLRLELDEVWPGGAHLLELGGRKCSSGRTRVFRDRAEALPHQDQIHRDASDFSIAHEMVAQLAVNCYVQPAAGGGELELWAWKGSDDEYERLRLPHSYGYDRDRIPPCAAVIVPEPGDLILFNAYRVHAVRSTTAGERITVSTFVGFRGADKPLVLWS